MTNILDYLDWLGDISFNEVKLNKIDYTLLTVSLIGLGVYVYYFLGDFNE